MASVRAKGKITLAVASTRIAATLLSKAQTAHSRFKIPIKLDQSSKCNINLNSPLARLTREAELIIGDEVVMQNRMAIECVDRTLKVVLNSNESFCDKSSICRRFSTNTTCWVAGRPLWSQHMPQEFLHLVTHNSIDANRKCKSSERLFRVFKFFKSSWRRNGNEKTVKLMRFT